MPDNELISIVLPIYKTERFLNRCISSVVNQTYTNLEIILVDDGSPDNCPSICDDWEKRDNRIKVIHKKNAGLGFARNTGIENATGEYICFFDSDDYIAPSLVEECYLTAKKEGADIVSYGENRVTEDECLLFQRIPSPPKPVFSGSEIMNDLVPMLLSYDPATGEDWRISLSAWGSMYSMRIIREHNWRFVSEREIISEDYYSVLWLYPHIKKVAYLDRALYYYTFNPNSLSQVFRRDRYQKIKYFALAMTELSASMGYSSVLRNRIESVYLGLSIGALKQIMLSNESMHVKYGAVREIIHDEYMQSVLRSGSFAGDRMLKKILYGVMRCKFVLLTGVIVLIRSLKG